MKTQDLLQLINNILPFTYLIRCRVYYFVLCHYLIHDFYYFTLFCCEVVCKIKAGKPNWQWDDRRELSQAE
jgi:hypothetical protein